MLINNKEDFLTLLNEKYKKMSEYIQKANSNYRTRVMPKHKIAMCNDIIEGLDKINSRLIQVSTVGSLEDCPY